MLIETNCALKTELHKKAQENDALALQMSAIEKELLNLRRQQHLSAARSHDGLNPVVKVLKEQLAKKDEELFALRTAGNATAQCWQALKTKRAEELKSPFPQSSYQINPQSTANIAAVRRILQGPLQYKGLLPESVEEMLSRSAEVMENLVVLQDFARSVTQAVLPSMSTAVASARQSDMSTSALATELKHVQIRLNEILGSCKHEHPQPQALRTSPPRSLERGEMCAGTASGKTIARGQPPTKRPVGRPVAPVRRFSRPFALQAKEESGNAVSSESSDSAPPPTSTNWVYRRTKGREATPIAATKQKEDPLKGQTREGRLSVRGRASFIADDPRTPRSRSHCDGMGRSRSKERAGSRPRGRSSSRGCTEHRQQAFGA
jgi:hypothetical protein